MTPEEFENQYNNLIAEAMVKAKHDDQFIATIIETIAGTLGRSIAMLSQGKQDVMSDFLDGAMHYAEEEAARLQKAGQLLGSAYDTGRRA